MATVHSAADDADDLLSTVAAAACAADAGAVEADDAAVLTAVVTEGSMSCGTRLLLVLALTLSLALGWIATCGWLSDS